jgi:transcriptional regulator with XRE-family HTH domain
VEAATARIGERVSTLRGERAMRVSELARRANVSSSLISQIERGNSRPSVGTLFALARALDVPVDAFFADPGEADAPAPAPGNGEGENAAGIVDAVQEARARGEALLTSRVPEHGRDMYAVRRDGRASIEIRGGVRWERLTPTALDGIEFLELVYAPGAESDRQSYRHPGIELVLVTEGVMTIFLGFTQYDLQAGDSIAFPSSTPHRYVNLTSAETRAVTVILRDELSTLALVGADEAPAEGEPAAPA